MECPRSSHGVNPIGTANILLAVAKYHFAKHQLLYKLVNSATSPIAGPNPPFKKETWGDFFIPGFLDTSVDTGKRCPGNPGPLALADLCGLRFAFLLQGLTFPW